MTIKSNLNRGNKVAQCSLPHTIHVPADGIRVMCAKPTALAEHICMTWLQSITQQSENSLFQSQEVCKYPQIKTTLKIAIICGVLIVSEYCNASVFKESNLEVRR